MLSRGIEIVVTVHILSTLVCFVNCIGCAKSGKAASQGRRKNEMTSAGFYTTMRPMTMVAQALGMK